MRETTYVDEALRVERYATLPVGSPMSPRCQRVRKVECRSVSMQGPRAQETAKARAAAQIEVIRTRDILPWAVAPRQLGAERLHFATLDFTFVFRQRRNGSHSQVEYEREGKDATESSMRMPSL